MSTTLTSKIVITRKTHVCFSCLRKFEAGVEMRYWAGIHDGDFNSIYSCCTCQKVMEWATSNNGYDDYYEGYPEGFVHEMLDHGQTPEQLLAKLTK